MSPFIHRLSELGAPETRIVSTAGLTGLPADELRLVELGADVERKYGQVVGQCYQQTPPIPLRTLDALHLASARVASESELVATDKRMRDAAKLLGFSVCPV